MDFLGLRNLTVVSDALENIALNGKPDPDLDHLAFDDEKTYELLGRGARPSACSSWMVAACATSSSS